MKLLLLTTLGALCMFAAGDYSNRRAPGFSLMDSHFQQHDPQDYRGRPVVIEFMLTTCPVCNALADTLAQVKAVYGDKIVILSLVALPDNFQTVAQFTSTHKVSWPILFDSGQVMMSYLRLTPANMNVHFPHLFFVDGKGYIRNDVDDVDGEKALSAAGISAEIDKLLK